MADDDNKLSTGRFARLAKLATMSAKLSTDVVARGVKRLANRDSEDSILGAGAAEKLVATLGDLKGLAMKIGQQVSMDPDLLTPEVRAVVARLQNQAPPMPYPTVRRVVTEQLGAAPEALYSFFDEEPMASASLGQVHRAVTKSGTDVAVKVQYPDIAKALKADLDNLSTMVSVVATSTRMVQGKEYYAELRESMLDELDYRQEAARAKQFAHAAACVPDVKVPVVFDELTAEKVLTLELLRGITLKDFLHHREEATPDEKFRAARLLIRAIWAPFVVHGVIHADPHPGNYMLLEDGRIGVLDFGAVKQLSDAWVKVNRELYDAVVHDRPVDVIRLSLESNFQFDDPEVARGFVQGVIDIATRPARTRDFDFTKASINRDMRNHFLKNAARLGSMKPPKEAVQFFRAIGGLSQNLENLGARGDFRGVYEELLALFPR